MNRLFNFLSQQRFDIPHLRSIESSVVANFDLLAGDILTGSLPCVVSGFEIVGSIGALADTIQMITAGGVLLHPRASEFGTLFSVPIIRATEILTSLNSRVKGSFTPNQVNYVGLDLVRAPDDSTTDLSQFLDLSTLQETPKEIPLGRTLDYVIVVSTNDFSATPNIAPVAKITTTVGNAILVIKDARSKFFRLGSGGSSPDINHAYSWPSGRTESLVNSGFQDGDKTINSQKEWMDAAMTRLWEIGGGEYWYSATADRNVKMVRTGAMFSNGEYFEWTGTNLHWKGLSFVFDNSTAFINTVTDQPGNSPGLTDLADGDCIYVDLDRTTAATLTAIKTAYNTLGTPTVPGSRHIIAWRIGTAIFTRDVGWPVGSTFFPATDAALGLVKLYTAANDVAIPVVPSIDTTNGKVVAKGISRSGAGGSLAAGAVSLGEGTNDNEVDIGKITTPTKVVGNVIINGKQDLGTGILPRLQFQDAGNGRWLVDCNGFPMGRISVFEENWWWDSLTISDGTTTDGTLLHGGRWLVKCAIDSAGYTWTPLPYPYINLSVPVLSLDAKATASALLSIQTTNPMFQGPGSSTRTGQIIVAEWEFQISIQRNQKWFVGFYDNAGNPLSSVDVKCYLYTDNGGFWHLVVGAVDLSVGTLPTFGNYQQFRIEMHGTGTPLGTALGGVIVVQCFIDGSLVAQVSTEIPFGSGKTGYFGWGAKNAGGGAGGTASGIMSNIRIVTNRYNSCPAL